MRPIDADALKESLCANCDNDICHENYERDKADCLVAKAFNMLVDDAPTIQPKRGEWTYESILYHCSSCGGVNGHRSNYCPNCGADNREVKDEE